MYIVHPELPTLYLFHCTFVYVDGRALQKYLYIYYMAAYIYYTLG